MPDQPRRTGEAGDADERLEALLRDFRASHHVYSLEHTHHRWTFVRSGEARDSLVILPGLGGTHEVEFEIIAQFERRFRVISAGYPETASTAEDLVEGVWALLDRVGVERAYLLGHSLGGMVAQACVFRHPERVRGLVLANTGVFGGLRKWVVPGAARLLSRVPEKLLRDLIMAQLERLVRPAAARAFWEGYFRAALDAPETRQYLRHQTQCLSSLSRFLSEEYERARPLWAAAMPVLMIESEDERVFSRRGRGVLASLYHDAQVCVFPTGTGHLSWLTRPIEFVSVTEPFLLRAAHNA